MRQGKSKKGWKWLLGSAGFVLLCGLFVLVLTAWLWQKRFWDDIKLIEIYSQLILSVDGTSDVIMDAFWLTCALPTGIAILLAAVWCIWLRRRPRRARALRWCALAAGLGLVSMLVYVGAKLEVVSFIRGMHTKSPYIEDNYVDPAKVPLTFPERKRNLVYIYLESMESTFSDEAHGGAFPKDVIPELTALAEENLSFAGASGGVNGGVSTMGTTWTMGGLFAQTAGLPLKIPVTDNSMSFQTSFFPGVTALGDILHDQGYNQALLIGSEGKFGGRKLYFQTHGDYQIWDYDYAKAQGWIDKDYHVWWGYEDQKLFAFARQQLTAMAQSDAPFNLTLLTVDTHFPGGYVCPLCPSGWGDDQYSQVMACSSAQVAEFLSWLRAQPFYENTTVVLCGDHVTMNLGYCDNIDPNYQRKTYTVFLNAAAQPASPDRVRQYTTMDLFPTTLAALGVQIPGNRLALGTNLFSDADTLLERDGLKTIDEEFAKNSELMNQLSGFDKEVTDLAKSLSDLSLQLEVVPTEEAYQVTVHGLEDDNGMFQKVEVFAEKMTGMTRTTLCMTVCESLPDQVYRSSVPMRKVADYDEFVLNVYVMIPEGRIKVGSGWLYRVSDGSLTPWEGPQAE